MPDPGWDCSPCGRVPAPCRIPSSSKSRTASRTPSDPYRFFQAQRRGWVNACWFESAAETGCLSEDPPSPFPASLAQRRVTESVVLWCCLEHLSEGGGGWGGSWRPETCRLPLLPGNAACSSGLPASPGPGLLLCGRINCFPDSHLWDDVRLLLVQLTLLLSSMCSPAPPPPWKTGGFVVCQALGPVLTCSAFTKLSPVRHLLGIIPI